jgi:type II secretory pathway pseudopilin PulG
LANGFTEWLNTGLPEHSLRQLADFDGSTLIYVAFAMIAAIVSWLNKRKEKAKLEQEENAAPAQRSQRQAQAEKPTGWLARLEQLAEAQLDKTDQELERQHAGNYEQESVETPMIIPADDLPPVIGTTARQTHRTGETPKRSVAVQASRKARQPASSPVYSSPIYTGNIAHRIGTDLRAAQQAVVASIILGQPRSLESPEQITRY